MSGSVRADDRGGHPCDGDPVPVRGAVKIFPLWGLPTLDLLIHRQTRGCAKLSIARGAHFLIWLFALAAVRRKLQIVSFG